MTDIPEDEWRYSINYGPEGEANYAFVYDGGGHLVSNLKIHHAIAVVEQMNDRAAQAERIRELEDVLDGIYIYANDTLSGRVDGPDDRAWQRAAVVEIRNRARKFARAARALSQEGSDANR